MHTAVPALVLKDFHPERLLYGRHCFVVFVPDEICQVSIVITALITIIVHGFFISRVYRRTLSFPHPRTCTRPDSQCEVSGSLLITAPLVGLPPALPR